MAHTTWMKAVEDERDPREKLRRAREAIAECMDTPDSPYFNLDSAQHNAYSEDILGCRQIIDELSPRFDVPPPSKNARALEFTPMPEFDSYRKAARLSAGGYYKKP